MHRLHFSVQLQLLLLVLSAIVVTANPFVECSSNNNDNNSKEYCSEEFDETKCNVSVNEIDKEFTVFMCADSGEYSGAHELGFLYNSLEHRHDVQLDYCHQAAIGLLQHADGHYLKSLVVTSGIGYLTAGLCTRSVLRLHAEEFSIDFFNQSVSTHHDKSTDNNDDSCRKDIISNASAKALAREKSWQYMRQFFTKHTVLNDEKVSENETVEVEREEESNVIRYKSIIYIGTAGFSPWVGGWTPPMKEHQKRRDRVGNNTFAKTTDTSHKIKNVFLHSISPSPSPYITLSAYKERQQMQESRAHRRGLSLLNKVHVNFEHVISQTQLYEDGCSPLVVRPNDNIDIDSNKTKVEETCDLESEGSLCDEETNVHTNEQVNYICTQSSKREYINLENTHECQSNTHISNASANIDNSLSIDHQTKSSHKEKEKEQYHQAYHDADGSALHRRVAVGSVCVTAGAFLQESTRCAEDVVYNQCSRLECDDMTLKPSTHQTHYLFNNNLANAIIASSRNKEFPPMPQAVRRGLQTYWSANEAMTLSKSNKEGNKQEKRNADTMESVKELKATFVPCVESTMNAISGGAMIDERCRRYTAATLNSQLEREDRNNERYNINNYYYYSPHDDNRNGIVWSADDVVCVQAMEGFGFLFAVKKYAPELPVAIIRTASNYDMYPQQKMYLSKETTRELLSERMPDLYDTLYNSHQANSSNSAENSSDIVEDIRAYVWRQNEEYTSVAEHESFVLSSFHYSIQTVTFVLSNHFLGGRNLISD